jgi:hypothetical protein
MGMRARLMDSVPRSGAQHGAELREVYVPLRALVDGPAPPWLGTFAHGLFFALLRHAQAERGRALHEAHERGNVHFTASALLDEQGYPVETVTRDELYLIRYALLTDEAIGDYWPAVQRQLTRRHVLAWQATQVASRLIHARVWAGPNLSPGQECGWLQSLHELQLARPEIEFGPAPRGEAGVLRWADAYSLAGPPRVGDGAVASRSHLLIQPAAAERAGVGVTTASVSPHSASEKPGCGIRTTTAGGTTSGGYEWPFAASMVSLPALRTVATRTGRSSASQR